MATNIDAAIDSLKTQFDNVLRKCYDALAADAPQSDRDDLREAIAVHLGLSDTEE